MQDLTRDLRPVLSNDLVKQLISIVQYFDPHGDPQDRQVIGKQIKYLAEDNRVENKDLPKWIQLVIAKQKDDTVEIPSVFSLLQDILRQHTAAEVYAARHLIMDWLQQTLYMTAPFVPHITTENARNLALGHPIALWLYDHAQDVDLLCTIAMVLIRPKNGAGKLENIPTCLVRLPVVTQRAKDVLFEHLQKIHDETIAILPLPYLQLFVKKETKQEEEQKEEEQKEG